MLALQPQRSGLLRDDGARLDESGQLLDLAIRAQLQDCFGDLARVMVLSEAIEDVYILLGWQALQYQRKILLRRDVVLKVQVGHKPGHLVEHNGGAELVEEEALLEHR